MHIRIYTQLMDQEARKEHASKDAKQRGKEETRKRQSLLTVESTSKIDETKKEKNMMIFPKR